MATDINTSMPAYVVESIQRILNDHSKALKGAKVLLLGITYKPDIADLRESPSLEVVSLLREKNADLRFFDPFVPTFKSHGDVLTGEPNLDDALAEADIVVLLQNHEAYDLDDIQAKSKVVFDTRGKMTGANVVRL
jgi:UDP-N-acetyl-D-mannosaminuronate dehydrogenase